MTRTYPTAFGFSRSVEKPEPLSGNREAAWDWTVAVGRPGQGEAADALRIAYDQVMYCLTDLGIKDSPVQWDRRVRSPTPAFPSPGGLWVVS
jgi:hypothetical protein